MSNRSGEGRDEQEPSVDEQQPPRRGGRKSHVVLPQSSSADASVADFVSRVSPTLRSNLVRYGLDEDDAEDVVQEVFARALAYRQGFPTARDFARWATVVARNLAYDRMRELERVEPAEIPQGTLPDPAEEVERWADIEALVRAYDSLSESDRRVLYAAAHDQRPTDAEERTRFRTWLHRAMGRLRGRMHGWLIALPPRLRARWPMESVAPAVGGALLVIELATGIAGPASSAIQPTQPTDRRLVETATVPTTPIPRERAAAVPLGLTNPPIQHPLVANGSTPGREQSTPGPGRGTYERVEVPAPGGGPLVSVDTHERETEDPPLVCLRNLPALGTKCVQK